MSVLSCRLSTKYKHVLKFAIIHSVTAIKFMLHENEHRCYVGTIYCCFEQHIQIPINVRKQSEWRATQGTKGGRQQFRSVTAYEKALSYLIFSCIHIISYRFI